MSYHPFHIVNPSPWPIILSLNIMSLMVSILMMIQTKSPIFMLIILFVTILSASQWWRDIIREATYQGMHTSYVTKGLTLGMVMFIVSEVMFFLSFFWTFFHMSLSPSIQIDMTWPPISITTFNPMLIPLLNTTILISSGITLTWAHHSILNFNFKMSNLALTLSIILGIYFTMMQAWEYYMAPFSMADSIYGSVFFVSTGFHGLHVIIGTIFLSVSFTRNKLYQFNPSHHLGFEASAWYWHFVDVVWLLLYSLIYWWGSL